MERPSSNRPSALELFERSPRGGAVTGIEVLAIFLSILWLVVVGLFFLLGGAASDADGLRFLMTLMVLFLPVGMIWVAATAARASRVMRDESSRLQSAVDALRNAYISQAQMGGANVGGTVTKKLEEIAAAQKKTESALAMFTSSRAIAAAQSPTPPVQGHPPAPGEDQGTLALGTPSEALSPPLPKADFIRALHFPETADDQAGFAALRRALQDRQAAQLVQAAQDVLTLLSQDGIYMDDLRPDMARPEVWRRFAHGARGREIAPLGGVRDRSSLALTAGRIKQDQIFRDAAHHFLRVFDKSFARFEADASDADITEFANTRTARAFMLLGRVAGTFD